MSVNRVKAKIIVENQRVGTANLRGDGPAKRHSCNSKLSDQRSDCAHRHFGDVLIKVGYGSLAGVLGAGPWRTTGKDKVSADLLPLIPN